MPSLNGKLASLSHFLSRGAKKQLPFLKVLKGCLGAKKISWTEEAEQAFVDMKAHIANLPTLTSPKPGETLYVYLATSKECISVVLVAEREKVQVPIYFVTRVLQGAEANYPELQKLTLALVHTARKLQRYFQAHPIIVLTNKQIRQVLMKPEKSGRMAKWAIELGEHDIDFQARHSIRAQVLADFMVETTETNEESDSTFAQIITPPVETKEWKLFTDGASSSDGSGAGLMLINPEGQEFTYALHFKFNTTNNEAEYEALLAELRIAKEMKIDHLQAFVDSQLVANQVLSKVKELMESFRSFTIEHVRRSQNKKADALSKLASITFAHLAKEVLVEVLEKRSIEAQEVHELVTEEENTWMKPIREYLELGILPEDKKEARKIRIKAPSYKMMNGALYRKYFLTPWLRCVKPNQASMIIREMHEGLHSGPRSIVVKILRMGYYWPTMHEDTVTLLRTCEPCLIHAKVQKQPKQEMISVLSAWPFSKWGIDLVGPLTEAPGGYKWLVVAIDYFTKWTKAKPLITRTGKHIEKFVWEHIVCRFGIPQKIVSDKGKQFAEGIFPGFCEKLQIKQTFTSFYQPQGNGQVEVTNRDILQGLEKRLGKCHQGWMEELPLVLWAHRTTPKRSNGETPYSLVYGTEAVLPTEIHVLTNRTANLEENEENLRLNLNLKEERREAALIREAAYKKTIKKLYNK
ncbi:uncharacterized protein [Rutidosis leptorrhynchoides]|uniref:uncharacterized protein n=1 Tax=Rutidosis leptorrhynchoides TaxID=125765 RepID=UPI003A994D8B